MIFGVLVKAALESTLCDNLIKKRILALMVAEECLEKWSECTLKVEKLEGKEKESKIYHFEKTHDIAGQAHSF